MKSIDYNTVLDTQSHKMKHFNGLSNTMRCRDRWLYINITEFSKDGIIEELFASEIMEEFSNMRSLPTAFSPTIMHTQGMFKFVITMSAMEQFEWHLFVKRGYLNWVKLFSAYLEGYITPRITVQNFYSTVMNSLSGLDKQEEFLYTNTTAFANIIFNRVFNNDIVTACRLLNTRFLCYDNPHIVIKVYMNTLSSVIFRETLYIKDHPKTATERYRKIKCLQKMVDAMLIDGKVNYSAITSG
jgi:hypothetical protein